MGPSQDESNGGNLQALSQPSVEGVDVLSPRRKLDPSGSCSSPNDPLLIPSAENGYERGVLTSTAVGPDLSSSSSSSNLLIKESPGTQVMERSMDQSHRIPSSVFEIDQSSDPVQWSTASSDSLFSIYIGNTSISRDYSLWCSDEHGTTGEASTDGPVHKPLRQVSDRPSVKLRAVEASLDTVKEDSRESEDHNHEIAGGRGSNASVKSFAFPILSGELDKGDSPGKLGSTARFSEQQQPQPASPSMQETEPLPQSEPKAPQKQWFSCFPCC